MAPGSDASGKAADGARPVHIDWDKAVENHNNEGKLCAFLLGYTGELRGSSVDMQAALANNDMESLLGAVQKVKGSASYVAASKLNNLASELKDAIEDEDDRDSILGLAADTIQEIDDLLKEILDLNLAGNAGEATPLAVAVEDKGGSKQCCVVL